MSQSHLAFSRPLLLAIVLIGGVAADQWTKHLATQHLREAPPRSWLGDTLRLQYALNSGGFLSFGSSFSAETRRSIFLGVNGVALTALCAFLVARRGLDQTNFIAGAMVLSGGVGNMIDRWCNQGLVVDFLNLGLGALRTGIFNVADIAITAGLAVWMFSAWQHDRELAVAAPQAEVAPPTIRAAA